MTQGTIHNIVRVTVIIWIQEFLKDSLSLRDRAFSSICACNSTTNVQGAWQKHTVYNHNIPAQYMISKIAAFLTMPNWGNVLPWWMSAISSFLVLSGSVLNLATEINYPAM